jgi:hypothetical protein
VGGEIDRGTIRFHGDRSFEERLDQARSLMGALSAEASIMARCTGKTDVRNLEPEDLRSITLATARATGIPLAGTRKLAKVAAE